MERRGEGERCLCYSYGVRIALFWRVITFGHLPVKSHSHAAVYLLYSPIVVRVMKQKYAESKSDHDSHLLNMKAPVMM